MTTGNIIIRVPEYLPEEGKLTVVVKRTGFAIYCEKEKVGQISNVDSDILKALAVSDLLGILEWPEGEEAPEYLERYAQVVDKMAGNAAKKTS
ncbi:MAG: hypothetical protein AAF556_00325 [Pseudomonadota bacterium]